MYAWFERQIDPLQKTKDLQPPGTLIAFYWHYVRQVWPWFVVILISGLIGSLIEVSLLAYVGQLVDLIKDSRDPESFFSTHGNTLAWMAFIAIIARPAVFFFHLVCINQAVSANLNSLIRWQTYRYVVRQSLGFFQNDFAGRIANKIMMTGPAITETVIQLTDALWFIGIYTVAALILFFQNDPRLMVPLLIWIVVYSFILRHFVPRIKDRAAIMSETRSVLMGRIVDSYTNILTVKLFSHAAGEDRHVGAALDDQNRKHQLQMRLISSMELAIIASNGILIVATSGLAIWLWSTGTITLGAIALATTLVIRINNMSHWLMWVMTGIFSNIGTAQEGMGLISAPRDVPDERNARQLQVTKGQIQFDKLRFHYGKGSGVIEDLSLTIRPGEKVGIVGRSGAGKSTLVNLALRFYDLEGGRILIDETDIASVQQDSLRNAFGMVTQDTSLLHRSVRDNILYGDHTASDHQVIEAAKRAEAHEFILDLTDRDGRRGYDAHVGERGVKLSGGQRQRIAIARVLLKDAPILILDEATSALDSEVEATIQDQLHNLMAGKTVISIAHRLSTIAAMDRLVVMDKGAIIEQGSHGELLAADGLYASLWSRQSGGFLAKETVV